MVKVMMAIMMSQMWERKVKYDIGNHDMYNYKKADVGGNDFYCLRRDIQQTEHIQLCGL